jgi:hypothetical protein
LGLQTTKRIAHEVLLSEYLLHSESSVAGAVFAGTLIAIALAYKVLWNYAAKNDRLLARNIDPKDIGCSPTYLRWKG